MPRGLLGSSRLRRAARRRGPSILPLACSRGLSVSQRGSGRPRHAACSRELSVGCQWRLGSWRPRRVTRGRGLRCRPVHGYDELFIVCLAACSARGNVSFRASVIPLRSHTCRVCVYCSCDPASISREGMCDPALISHLSCPCFCSCDPALFSHGGGNSTNLQINHHNLPSSSKQLFLLFLQSCLNHVS